MLNLLDGVDNSEFKMKLKNTPKLKLTSLGNLSRLHTADMQIKTQALRELFEETTYKLSQLVALQRKHTQLCANQTPKACRKHIERRRRPWKNPLFQIFIGPNDAVSIPEVSWAYFFIVDLINLEQAGL